MITLDRYRLCTRHFVATIFLTYKSGFPILTSNESKFLLKNKINYFCHAVALWDFLPDRTAAAINRAQQSIRVAIEIAESVKKDDVCIYSYTRTYGEIITADEFVSHMENCLQLIDATIEGKTDKNSGKAISAPDKTLSSSLMTLNF